MPNPQIGWNAVRPWNGPQRSVHHTCAMGTNIGTLIVKEFVFDPQDSTFLINRHARTMALLARMVCRDQMFASILDPFDRSAHTYRRHAHQHIFRIELAAYSKTAADVKLVQMQGIGAAAKHFRERVAIAMRHF